MGIATLVKNKRLLTVAALFSTFLVIVLFDTNPPSPPIEYVSDPIWSDIQIIPEGIENRKLQEWWDLRSSTKNLSKLGEVLFLMRPEPKILDTEKRFQILVWKYGRTIENRHLKHFSGNRCPGHFGTDCPKIDEYLFYLSFENSNCDEYITEKLWWNAYHKNSIPIVMGSSRDTYKKLLPLDSFINVDNFAGPRNLAEYILRLNETGEYRSYYNWKKNFEVLNEHGYFQTKSYHYCRVCQALNYNTKNEKVYDNLENFWSTQGDCHGSWDTWKD